MDEILLFLVLVAGLTVGTLCGLWLLGMVVRAAYARVHHRLIERVVIGQIATVVRQQLPLATGVALAADSEPGRPGLLLRRISRRLGEGASLSEAIRLSFPECTGLVVSLVAAGERAGQLPAALDQTEQFLIDESRHSDRPDVSVGAYLVVMFSFMFLVVAGIMIAVVPKFKEIFSDFGTALPGMTLSLIDVSEWFVQGKPPGWVVLVVPIPIVLFLWLRPRRYPDPGVLGRAGDWIRWRVPGWRRIELGRGMAAVLRTLRLTTRSGMDLASGARLASELDVNTALRHRVQRFAAELAAGRDAKDASASAGLGQVTSISLAAGQRSHDMDAALRYAADYYGAIVSRWWIVVGNLVWPVSTLALATLVGWVVLSLFLPLVTLIHSVSM